MKKWWYIIIAVTAFFSCKKDNNISPVNFYYDYFPVQTGFWRIYEVDSIVHDENDDFTGKIDTFHYQIKEVIAEKFIDLSGDTAYRLERFIRNNPSDKWKIKDVWYFNFYPSKIEMVEENLRLIKMIFPVKENATWDGNASNANPEQIYEYQNTHEPYVTDNFTFDSTATVLIEDYENLIEKQLSKEVYAKNIGLIHKSVINIDYQAEGGLEYYLNISDWSK
ncbi:MAG: hypothetical protein D6707_02555 [Bacteroidetes bacterium]|nr:MAG: hypothetical protein D6707_02555 [Bacteroidota bacterium]